MTLGANRSRQRILKAAEEIFFVRGLADTCIDAIIDTAAASPD
ncbi:MAG: hypothetical protein OSA45_13430 [Halioglobus sp.]|nr:hypothetical protein [Halioglobus sp.]